MLYHEAVLTRSRTTFAFGGASGSRVRWVSSWATLRSTFFSPALGLAMESTSGERIQRQMDFLVELDKLKQVLRQTWLMDASRRENDAEHSWHLGVMTLVLAEHAADPPLDLARVVKMVLVHDIVEIDAGDTFAYDDVGALDKVEREQAAARRLFALLPTDQEVEFRSLWQEFEARESPEARFAAALDRLQPILHNYHTRGKAWIEHGITADQVRARNRHIAEGSPRLWEYVEQLIRDAVVQGFLAATADEA